MSEAPRRWRDDPTLGDSPSGRELRAWLRSAPGIAPLSASTRQAVADRIQVSLASGAGSVGEDATDPAPANGAAAAPAAAPQLALLSAAKLACVVVVVAAAGAGVWLSTSRGVPSAGPERPAQSPVPRATPPSQPSFQEQAEAEPARLANDPGAAPAPALPTAPAASEPTGKAHARAAARAPSAPVPRAPESGAGQNSAASATALREEVRLLRGAREQLALDPARAAELLREYAARFPDGALKAEYAALVARLGPRGSSNKANP